MPADIHPRGVLALIPSHALPGVSAKAAFDPPRPRLLATKTLVKTASLHWAWNVMRIENLTSLPRILGQVLGSTGHGRATTGLRRKRFDPGPSLVLCFAPALGEAVKCAHQSEREHLMLFSGAEQRRGQCWGQDKRTPQCSELKYIGSCGHLVPCRSGLRVLDFLP